MLRIDSYKALKMKGVLIHLFRISTDGKVLFYDGEDKDSNMDGYTGVKDGTKNVAIIDNPKVTGVIMFWNEKGDLIKYQTKVI